MLHEKPFKQINRQVECEQCGHKVEQWNALHYKGHNYCGKVCRDIADYDGRVKVPT